VHALAWIPGVGKKKARAIAAGRPFMDLAAFRAAAGETPLDGAFSFRVP
jgi:radical SAM superfamily enzyme with C-terminal helix-hairpin-helix motif